MVVGDPDLLRDIFVKDFTSFGDRMVREARGERATDDGTGICIYLIEGPWGTKDQDLKGAFSVHFVVTNATLQNG